MLGHDDTLLLGRVYRFVSLEEVLKEFATKWNIKLIRVMVKAKEEVAAMKLAKPRRWRGSSSGGGGTGATIVGEEPAQSLAKLCSHLSVRDTSDAHSHIHCNHRLSVNLS